MRVNEYLDKIEPLVDKVEDWSLLSQAPVVSVWMITFNHEAFIRQAIDGVLMQQTAFDYELVIGDDKSTDLTREIVAEYQRRHPDRIRLRLAKENLRSRNLRQGIGVLAACRGRYVASCEGDDYWTDPHKLQKQVDFLDRHPECVSCFHNVTVIYEDGSQDSHTFCPPDQKEISTVEDLLAGNFMPTCSVMFRNHLVDQVPEWFSKVAVGDWPSHVLRAQYGDIGYINQVMGAYRVHAGGIWSQRDPIRGVLADTELFGYLNAHFHFRYDDLIRTRISIAWGGAAAEMIKRAAETDRARAALSAILSTYGEWSSGSAVPAAWKAQTLGYIYAGSLFASHMIHATAMARYCFFKAAQYDRSWLRNWGVWSILLDASFGRPIAGFLRRKARNAWPQKSGSQQCHTGE